MRVSKFRFHEFELDTASRELRRDGQRVALPPKSFECMTYLLVHRERAVGRDELISAVWGRVDVSDTVVAQTLFRARKALGDSGQESRLIRTVPRFGYQWIARLSDRPMFDAEESTNVSGTCPPCVTRANGGTWHGWGSLLLLFSAAGFAGWMLPRERMLQSNATVGAPASSSESTGRRDVQMEGAARNAAALCRPKEGAHRAASRDCTSRSPAVRDARVVAFPVPTTLSRTSP